jgi:1-acyl-sn-glycerol-3-phosphate acyltransferase
LRRSHAPSIEWVYWLGRVLCYPLRIAFRIRRIGSHHVPRRGPVLLAVNHVSLLDPLIVLWLGECTRRKVRFLAMAELWRNPVLGFFLDGTRQIPVARASLDAVTSLRPAEDALAAGECVCIFPEGVISDDLELTQGKTGVARLARTTGVPVTPVALWGTQRVHAKGRRIRLRPGTAICIVVGEPVEVRPDDDTVDATNRIMEGVARCLATARDVYPQRPRAGEDGWWVRSAQTAVIRPTTRERSRSRWS